MYSLHQKYANLTFADYLCDNWLLHRRKFDPTIKHWHLHICARHLLRVKARHLHVVVLGRDDLIV